MTEEKIKTKAEIVIKEVKEYKDILDLAGGIIDTSIKEIKEDGFQWKDLITIISENVDKGIEAVKDITLVDDAWKLHTRECILVTGDFIIDQVLKLLGKTETTGTFKETQEMIDAVSGITLGIIEKATDVDGLKLGEVFEVLSNNLKKIVTGIEGITLIDDEFKANSAGFLKMIVRTCVTIAFDIKEMINNRVKKVEERK